MMIKDAARIYKRKGNTVGTGNCDEGNINSGQKDARLQEQHSDVIP